MKHLADLSPEQRARAEAQIAFYDRLAKHEGCSHPPMPCSAEKHAMLRGSAGDVVEVHEARTRAMVIEGKCRCCGEAVGNILEGGE